MKKGVVCCILVGYGVYEMGPDLGYGVGSHTLICEHPL